MIDGHVLFSYTLVPLSVIDYFSLSGIEHNVSVTLSREHSLSVRAISIHPCILDEVRMLVSTPLSSRALRSKWLSGDRSFYSVIRE